MKPIVEQLVSTVIPVYNRPQLLAAAVQSVLAQTWRHLEIVIVDDGSTDDTPHVAESLAREHAGVVSWLRIDNAGPGPAREAGRRQARGEFLQYLDSDDRLLPSKFELQVAALRRRPECGIAYGTTRLIDEHGSVLKSPFKWTGEVRTQLFPGLLVDRWWCTHTPLYRRSVCDAVGPWSDLRWSQDWEYDARAAALGTQLVRCDAEVSEHCHHSGERQTSAADWERDPVRLRNRVQLLQALWRCAEAAGVADSAPERQHFARWAFSIARRCAAAGLIEEMHVALNLAQQSAGRAGRGAQGVRMFRWLSRSIGPVTTGRFARSIESLRRNPGPNTLPQSFSTNGP
ncbi:MAG: glycosyltransferase family 2 protein [Planctomycetaceae bacterium]|nr:glycosyltransferase family 2 protein [Planctomycetaceae bacterium]